MAPHPPARPSTRPADTRQQPVPLPPPTRRKRLTYSRISVACSPCRLRKIRCIPAKNDARNRCFDCIRLNKTCTYSVVHNGREADAAIPPPPPAPQEIEKPDDAYPRAQGNVRAVDTLDVSYPFLQNPVGEMTYPLVQNTSEVVNPNTVNSLTREMAGLDVARPLVRNNREVLTAYPAVRGVDNTYSVAQETDAATYPTGGTGTYSVGQNTAVQATWGPGIPDVPVQNNWEVLNPVPNGWPIATPGIAAVQNTWEMTTPANVPAQNTWEMASSDSVAVDRLWTEEELYYIFNYMA